MNQKKEKYEIGDVFLVQTMDGKKVVGQIIGKEAEVLNSATIAFFDLRISSAKAFDSVSLTPESVFSTVFATRELLTSGEWQIIGRRPVSIPSTMFPYEDRRLSGFVGARVIGAGILCEFVNAFYSLVPWDDWNDPDYLNDFLVNISKKPENLMLNE